MRFLLNFTFWVAVSNWIFKIMGPLVVSETYCCLRCSSKLTLICNWEIERVALCLLIFMKLGIYWIIKVFGTGLYVKGIFCDSTILEFSLKLIFKEDGLEWFEIDPQRVWIFFYPSLIFTLILIQRFCTCNLIEQKLFKINTIAP